MGKTERGHKREVGKGKDKDIREDGKEKDKNSSQQRKCQKVDKWEIQREAVKERLGMRKIK